MCDIITIQTIVLMRGGIMAVTVKKDYQKIMIEHNKEVRNLVLEGLQQIQEGKTKDFNKVCERLEQKYGDDEVQD